MPSYIDAFRNLRTDKNRKYYTKATTYRAPNKPILLLCILDLISQGNLNTNFIELNAELIELFQEYWNCVMPPERRGNIAMPFFHMRSEKFWHLLPKPGYEKTLDITNSITSVRKIHESILGAKLDGTLFTELQDAETRNLYRRALIETYFIPDLHKVLVEQGIVNQDAYQYSLYLLETARQQKETRKEDIKPAVRDQGFRRAIVVSYEHRCAFCGVRMRTPDGQSAVVAAHIIPWSISCNDDPRNGIALCHLCHWTFDRGLMSISGKYMVLVSDYLRSTNNLPGHLLTLVNRKMMGPEEEVLWPDLDNLKWHRKEVFFRK